MDVVEWIKLEMKKGSSEEIIRETLELLGYNEQEINELIVQAKQSSPSSSSPKSEVSAGDEKVKKQILAEEKLEKEKKEENNTQLKESLPYQESLEDSFDSFSASPNVMSEKEHTWLYNAVTIMALLYAFSFILVWLSA
ncbi:MAG: hypothetical protein GXN99_01405 [Candidatus Nanohaloarchaeota archaeon]|nr:hypothetical protein [Candidatus Nanohaloarchaeota archaeon]